MSPADRADDTAQASTADNSGEQLHAGVEQLAREVEDLDSRLTDLEQTALNEAAAMSLAEELGKLGGRVATTEQQLAQRLQAVEDLTSRGHWDPHLPELELWVDEWLIPTYYLGSILRGWQTNSAIVQELAALRIAWRRVASPKAGGFDALSWHDHLARVIARIPDHRDHRDKALR